MENVFQGYSDIDENNYLYSEDNFYNSKGLKDNIFTRVYNDDVDKFLYSEDYSEFLGDFKDSTYIYRGLRTIVMPASHIKKSENMKVLKKIYDHGNAIILTDVTYDDIKYLHMNLKIQIGLGYLRSSLYKCIRCVDRFGYYGINKGYNGSINQLYYEFVNSENIRKQVLDGVGVDETCYWLTNNLNGEDYSVGINNNDLTKLASSQNFTFFFQEYNNLRYFDNSKNPNLRNSYGINFTVYPVHSLNDGSDYYFIEQNNIFNFNNSYVEPYKYTYKLAQSKIEEFYCSDLATDCYFNIPINKVNIMRFSPNTTENKTTITNGISWGIGGDVSVNQEGLIAKITGGVSVSTNKSIQVKGVNVYNRCATRQSNAQWEYAFLKTSSEFSFFSYGQVDLIPCSISAHSTFTPTNQWVWRVLPDGRPSGDEIQCNCSLWILLTSSRARLATTFYTEVEEHGYTFLKEFLFNIKQAPIPKVM